jgi:putative glutathione S-transferase
LSVLHPRWNTPHGWSFQPSPMSTPDLVNGFDHLHQLYSLDGRGYTGRVTVPVLWDRVERSIVSNDSAEILRLLSEMPLKEPGVRTYDLYPPALRRDMGEVWERDLDVVATGVYAVGGATSQEAYETLVRRVFAALDRLDELLSDERPFLHGEVLTASDVLLFTPAVRFDAVYHPIFRASLRRFSDYERLSAWTARMLKIPGVAATVRLDEIRLHYDDGWAPRCDGIKPLATTEPPRTTARVAVL